MAKKAKTAKVSKKEAKVQVKEVDEVNYKDLQEIAKDMDIKATGTTEALKDRIEAEEEKPVPQVKKAAKAPAVMGESADRKAYRTSAHIAKARTAGR